MKGTISNSLIIISAIFTIISFQNSEIFSFGMHRYYLQQGDYIRCIIQLCFYSFIHGGFLHLMFNNLFLFTFGNRVEEMIGKRNYIIFFLGTTFFNAIALLMFSSGTTIGISGFGMALLSFYTLKLYEIKDNEYKGGVTAIIINILIGFSATISLIGHFFGAIFGGFFYIIIRIIKKY